MGLLNFVTIMWFVAIFGIAVSFLPTVLLFKEWLAVILRPLLKLGRMLLRLLSNIAITLAPVYPVIFQLIGWSVSAAALRQGQ